jgi:hypothetical protein
MSVTAYGFDVSVSTALTWVGAGQPTDGGRAPVVGPLAPGLFQPMQRDWHAANSGSAMGRCPSGQPGAAWIGSDLHPPGQLHDHGLGRRGEGTAAAGPRRPAGAGPGGDAKRFVFIFWTQPGGISARRRVHRRHATETASVVKRCRRGGRWASWSCGRQARPALFGVDKTFRDAKPVCRPDPSGWAASCGYCAPRIFRPDQPNRRWRRIGLRIGGRGVEIRH